MIELSGVRHRYQDREVLGGIDLRLTERRIGVVGLNGSGKSTFARLLNGLLIPSAGTVTVDGLDTRRDGPKVRRRVGFVFQDPDVQIVMPTVAEDVAFGLRGLPKPEVNAKVKAALAEYGLSGYEDHAAHLLSGGQKQMLAMASITVLNPSTIVFDEPTTLLDLRNRQRIADRIKTMPQDAIVISHDLDLLADFDRVLVIHEGKIVADCLPEAAIEKYVAIAETT
ncbi:ABC transporter ATP-binding protein [Pseudonocardiaceae bacterium YIM PH 21723]|nr:ABC transporter ATP-binding protein [Pseudonocardiaceae bacterium YIM PH 21723]